MQLKTQEINPRLLKCAYFNGYEIAQPFIKRQMASRICYDYEFEYYLKSDGGIIVNSEYIPFGQGEINIRKPGQTVCGYSPYECYIVCFSMNGENCMPENYGFGSQKQAQPFYENALLSTLPNKLIPVYPQRINTLFNDIYRASQSMSELSCFKTNALLYNLLYELLHQCMSNSTQAPLLANGEIRKAIKYIKSNFCDEILINKLIEESGISKAYFHRCFKKYTGVTPNTMIQSMRIEKAKNLLCMTDTPISQISELCGYYDNVYFSHIFKREIGCTPSQFRQIH